MENFFERFFTGTEQLPEGADEKIITAKFLKNYKPSSEDRQLDVYYSEVQYALNELDIGKVQYPEQTAYKKKLRDLAMKSHITATEVSGYLSTLYKMKACMERQKTLEFQPDLTIQDRIRNLAIDFLPLPTARNMARMMMSLLHRLRHHDNEAVAELLQQMETDIQECQKQLHDQAAAGGLSIFTTDQNTDGRLSISKPENEGGLSVASSEKKRE